ncbi:MAG: 1-acyl-sn-glycerol-3-phosphate acyltransferase [Candidatus Symbiothrix sp.]|jgi:1-acyl-sn-glycerol-3-phosphate acyltransferase|nr:1-acyl-sn-glycerol-3-phosphate acyltransferase [Candidatus Symbiothrix sp.]
MKRFSLLIYQIFIWAPLFLITTFLTASIVIIGCFLGGERFFSYYPGMCWSKCTCMLTLCPVKVTGREKLDKKQSYIFISNHQGAYDIFLIYGYIGQSIKWVMKKSLRKIPFVGKACELAGFIFVDNSSPKAATQTIRDAEEKLKNGASIAIFPEGSRTRTGKTGKFKKGAYQMAIDLKLPIVPITINGSYEVLPIGSYFINPHKMELIIHDPIPIEQFGFVTLREAAVKIGELVEISKGQIESGLWNQYK